MRDTVGRSGLAGAKQAERRFAPLLALASYLRPYRLQILGAAVALVVAAATVLGLGAVLRRLVDDGLSGGNAAMLDRAVIGLLAVVVVAAAATYARYFLVSWIGERVIADLRRAVYARVLSLSPGFFEVTPTGEILSRLTSDTTLVQTVVGSSASVALRNLLLLAGGTVMLAITSLKLTLMVSLIVPLVLVPILVFGRKVRRLSRDSQDRIADVGAYVDETLNAVRTVQAFTHEAHDRMRFGGRVEDAFAAAVRRIRARALLTAVVIFLVFGAVSVVLWIGGRDMLAGEISPGQLSAFVFYAIVVAGAAGAVSEVIGELQRAAGAMERLVELLATEPDIKAPADPVPLKTPAAGAIAFERVTFHYPSRPDRSALSEFSLAVAPGETVALVGPSGAGKSTVFQLLLRFYDPGAGVVRLDGVELALADPSQVRQRIGLVPQEPVIFSANAWENIRYGRPEASDAEVRQAAEAAFAAEFLDRLPDGFGTHLGEKGVRLSGGQRQRLAIARAILRDPAVLLLDEATSALDAESERAVQQALDRLMAGRTTLVIAHRLATVLKVKRIAVMDQGQVVATGSHAELIRSGGLYARLAELQFEEPRAEAARLSAD
ncbi:MAG: ATP-binding cassette domain-containing protein [Proteobacteria bacterium]|nr:ATP-binding cassette domain-containing protein [Pseudomonadota bacterium]MBI3500061.1 ATP-binding cassette domain-containing protein [Pseudomonadota bacterium]